MINYIVGFHKLDVIELVATVQNDSDENSLKIVNLCLRSML